MSNINSTKKKLSPEQRSSLLGTLKARFEKNMKRHKGIEWATIQAKLDQPKGGEKLWPLNEMESTGGERMLLAMIKKRADIYFIIVQQKVQTVAEAFVMTMKRWRKGKKINMKIAPLIWLTIWVLSF